MLVKSIVRVQGVYIRALQPVAKGRHQIHEQVFLDQLGVGLLLVFREASSIVVGFVLVVVTGAVGDRAAEGQKYPENVGKLRHFGWMLFVRDLWDLFVLFLGLCFPNSSKIKSATNDLPSTEWYNQLCSG